MEDLFKKFYWLIISAVFSLFVFLLTLTFKQIGNIYFPNPIDIITEEWSTSLESIRKSRDNRAKEYIEINSRTDSLYKIQNFNFAKLFDNSINYDFQIRVQVERLDKIITETNIYINTPMSVLNDAVINLKDQLECEIELWELYGNYSIAYLKNKRSFDWQQFRVDIKRQVNKYLALNISAMLLEFPIGKFVTDSIISLLIIAFLAACIVGLSYIVVIFLLPVGLELWKEKTNNHQE